MKTYYIEAWEVVCPDGGGMSEVHVAYFSSEMVATQYAASKSWPHHVNQYKKLVTVFDTIGEFDEHSQDKLRKSALAKLSPQERAALGV